MSPFCASGVPTGMAGEDAVSSDKGIVPTAADAAGAGSAGEHCWRHPRSVRGSPASLRQTWASASCQLPLPRRLRRQVSSRKLYFCFTRRNSGPPILRFALRLQVQRLDR